MKYIYLLSFLSCFLLLTCFVSAGATYSDSTTRGCMQSAGKQLDEALVLMQKHYYRKDVVAWDSLVAAARGRIAGSANCEEAFETVNWCFQQLKEVHSFIMPRQAAAFYNNDTVTLKRRPHLSQLVGEIKCELMADKGIAYLSVPAIGTTDTAICALIADSLQRVIASLDQPGITKWIVDLRNNTGGNCWPMIAGMGPLLGEGVCGYFVSPEEKVAISYRNGQALQGNNIRCRTRRAGYRLKAVGAQIIVLTGPKTSSSGEILALAFKGRPQTLLYGQPTAGLTTANTTYTLSDQSMLVLTICEEADRFGTVHQGPIRPDVMIAEPTVEPMDDAALSAAVMWLHIQ